MTRKNTFKKIYLIFAGVLLVIMAVCLIHVGSVLKEYEASQPEHFVLEQYKAMQTAAKNGTLEELIGKYYMGAPGDGLITAAENKINSAEGELSCRLLENADGGERLYYTILAGGERVADIRITGETGDTKLMLFSMTEWTVSEMAPPSYSYDITLPASMTVIMNGETVTDEDPDGDGRIEYHFAADVDEPEVIIRDSLGSETVYDGETALSITEYAVQIPSNYRITSADGSVTVSTDSAKTEAIDDYKYVAQYIAMPETATYRLGIFGETADFKIVDNLGTSVDYTLDGHTVKIEGQASSDTVPEGFMAAEDILTQARKWSLFMTADLGGATRGYGQIEEFLLPDSYLMNVAYQWATGVDITFTSVHTLDNPPFSEESVTGFVKYSDECFSVDVKLTKIMHLNSGADVTDTMNCRFYYILKDGVWYVADIQEII